MNVEDEWSLDHFKTSMMLLYDPFNRHFNQVKVWQTIFWVHSTMTLIIQEEENLKLFKATFTCREFKQTLDDIPINSSPNPNSFGSSLYLIRMYRDHGKRSFTRENKSFLRSGITPLPPFFSSSSFIITIPKKGTWKVLKG